jgi:hypothetical protein
MKAFLSCALLLAFCQSALAQCCCDHCGCQSDCHKICRVVCETKKVPKIEYDCECEDFCVPGPSCRTTVCDECGNKKHVYTPGCGEVRTRTKLVKKETMEEKVVYKWVVQTVCGNCESRCVAADKAAGLDNPEKLAGRMPSNIAKEMAQPVSYQFPSSDVTSATVPQPEPPAEKPRFDLLKMFRSRTAAKEDAAE